MSRLTCIKAAVLLVVIYFFCGKYRTRSWHLVSTHSTNHLELVMPNVLNQSNLKPEHEWVRFPLLLSSHSLQCNPNPNFDPNCKTLIAASSNIGLFSNSVEPFTNCPRRRHEPGMPVHRGHVQRRGLSRDVRRNVSSKLRHLHSDRLHQLLLLLQRHDRFEQVQDARDAQGDRGQSRQTEGGTLELF